MMWFAAFLLAALLSGHSIDFIHIGKSPVSRCRTAHACAPHLPAHQTHER